MQDKGYQTQIKIQTKATISKNIIISIQQSLVFAKSLSILLFTLKICMFPLSTFFSIYTNKGF